MERRAGLAKARGVSAWEVIPSELAFTHMVQFRPFIVSVSQRLACGAEAFRPSRQGGSRSGDRRRQGADGRLTIYIVQLWRVGRSAPSGRTQWTAWP